MEVPSPETPPWTGGGAVAGLGLVLCAGYVVRLASGPETDAAALAFGVLAPLCAAVMVTVVGVRIASRGAASVRAAVWALLGGVSFAGIGALIVNYQSLLGAAPPDVGVVLLNTATGGVVAGLVVGLYDERSRRARDRAARREAELERERDRFRTLFENLPNPVLRFRVEDGEPVIEGVNEAFEDTFGYSAAEATGERVRDLLVPPDREGEAAANAAKLEAGQPVRKDVRRMTADGVRDFLLIAIPIRLGASTSGHAVLIDVTERERYVQRLEVFNRLLRHDLRNDASVIVGYAQTIAELGGEAVEPARVIEKRAEEMVERSDRVRHIGSVLEGEGAEERSALRPLVADRVADARAAHPHATVESEVECNPVVRGGPLLGEALSQLLDNAVEHNDVDPTVRVRVEDTDGAFVAVIVADDGPGIPERERDVLERGRESALEHSMGTGLWLARWAVGKIGGDIDIRCGGEGGTEVVVRVPVAE